jgi:hypothetical protein
MQHDKESALHLDSAHHYIYADPLENLLPEYEY